MTTKSMFLSYILEFACRHKYENVIRVALEKHRIPLSSLGISKARVAAVSLHKIVHHEMVHEFNTAVSLAEQLFQQLGDKNNHTFVKTFIKLLCGLKVKALFHTLEKAPQEGLKALGRYFPRNCRLMDDLDTIPELAQEYKDATLSFRKSFFPHILHPEKRKEFMASRYEQHFGKKFLQALKRSVTSFIDCLEEQWPDTFLEKLLKEEKLDGSPDSLLDILLDFVEGKTHLEEQDLMDLVEILDPERPLSVEGFTSSFFDSQAAAEKIRAKWSSQSREKEDHTASQEHAISSSSDSINTNSQPTASQPFEPNTCVSAAQREESPAIRLWTPDADLEKDFYTDGSISDVDMMSRGSQKASEAQEEGVEEVEGQEQEMEVVPSSSHSTVNSELEANSVEEVLESPRKTKLTPRKLPRHLEPRECPRLHQKYLPDIGAQGKTHDLHPCMVRLTRSPKIDDLACDASPTKSQKLS